jgi:hypothetical protein
MMVAKGCLNNGELTLIPVMAKMIHSAVWECKRLLLKDGQPHHMVKFVGAVRNFCVNTKYVQIDVENGTGLVRVILWREEKDSFTWRNLEGHPAQPGLTWRNLEGYPGQPGLTWRNLEGYQAQPGLIPSSVRLSVHE